MRGVLAHTPLDYPSTPSKGLLTLSKYRRTPLDLKTPLEPKNHRSLGAEGSWDGCIPGDVRPLARAFSITSLHQGLQARDFVSI